MSIDADSLKSRAEPRLSVVIVAYNMARELPRTIRSLGPVYQNLKREIYEVIVMDNGSEPPVSAREFADLDLNLTIVRMENPSVSPVPAIRRGMELARGELIGAFIDGARMASPGVLKGALSAARIAARPVIATLGFHLGPDVQMRSIRNGYDEAVEDALLDSIAWPEDGYRLFEIATFAWSSSDGWFGPLKESNGLFLKRADWERLGGFDPGFESPGGGFCNLDVYKRACNLDRAELIVLLGEGTFHQVHGGIATNLPVPPHGLFIEEYQKLRGEAFSPPEISPVYLGCVPVTAMPSIEFSARLRYEKNGPTESFALGQSRSQGL